MKKLLLTFIALFACVTYVAAQEIVTESFAAADAEWYTTLKADAANQTTLTSTNTGITYNSEQAYNANGYLMLVGKSVTPKGYIKFSLDFPCSNITIYSKAGASGSQAVTVSAGSTVIKENTKIPNVADGNLSIEVPEASQAAGTEFTIQASAAYNAQITKIVYTKVVNTNLQPAGLSFPESQVTLTLGDAFTGLELTKDTDAAATYVSENPEVATVDATTGVVELVAEGTTKITASTEETATYRAGTASYTITVLPEGVVFQSADGTGFTFENPADLSVWSIDSYGYLKASAFKNSKPNAAVAVAYTSINLSGKENVSLKFDNAFNQYKLNNAMIDPADFDGYAYVVAREKGATEWTDICQPTKPTAFNWTFYSVEPVNLDAYKGKEIELGFKYVSTEQVAGTWEVKNIVVTADNVDTAIEDIEAADAPVEYYNLQGIRVANPTSGLYIKRQGNKATKVIL